MLKHKPRKAFCRLWLLRPEESVPLRFLVPSPGTSFSLSGGGCHDLNQFFALSRGFFWLGG